MDVTSFIMHHGYIVTLAVMFLASVGLPMPGATVLLAAGAAAHAGALDLSAVLALACVGAMSGDSLLFFGGRYTGWWLLGILCRVSINPEACIFSSAGYFYRRGPKTLLFAKFIPGLGAMSAPIAGSLHMRTSRFLRLDAVGVLAYCSAWIAGGYLFSGIIQNLIHQLERAGHAVALGLLLAVLTYGTVLIAITLRTRRGGQIEKVSAASLHERMQALTPDKLVVIADVRSHGYYDPGMQRIKNSIRVEPHKLLEEVVALREFMAPECEIYLYCSCIRDTTSIRVARKLAEENCRTQVIEGGIKAWIKAGGPMELVPEADLQKLPRFE
jgi:membrane protein DedA with SNARE-associated domain/rhodanese-related sulfurtransferase